MKEEEGHSGGVSPDDVKASDGPGCDPFLRALARGGDPKALKAFASTEAELDAKATEAERGLRRRADATKAALAALLQRMDAERQRFEARLADAAPTEAADQLRRSALRPMLMCLPFDEHFLRPLRSVSLWLPDVAVVSLTAQ